VNAAANRLYEMGRVWAEAGNVITVVTSSPNHPNGILYPGYLNKLWQREKIAGMDVVRVWTLLAPNEGFLRRSMNYLSFLVMVVLAAPFLPKADIVVSTSPHLFCGIAGYPISRFKHIPWVLEIRDLWPESIVAVGALKPGALIGMLRMIERFAYRHARHIVTVSDAFVPRFTDCGVASQKISIITNGVDRTFFTQSNADSDKFRERYNLEGRFVASYIGTHGMAHGLQTMLEAAHLLRERADILFLLIGDGAERRSLVRLCREMALRNVLMLPQMSRAEILCAWAASDAAIVPLRNNPTFELVIPSKMLEAFAMGKPVLLGVRGKARQIVETGNCGLAFHPEDSADLARVITALANDRRLASELGKNGVEVAAAYDSNTLAHKYLQLLMKLVGRGTQEQSQR
jgi:glycosyltransferase involved in cell wall biosynthesis